ncbi:hypothetical protein [Kutzneria buriramensis]|uniref:hypothetical protein n=1 Tax=Kutzneria buriramensis TaxID=1045776 RepID=UPI001476AB81
MVLGGLLVACVLGAFGASGQSAGRPSQASRSGQVSTTSTSETTTLGTVVTTGNGFTRYRFNRDTPHPPTSNCADDWART